jgi:glycosyltransferase involved in cell wall biosynthesis
MISKPNLHIFITSKLNIFGGGCETWLEYFLRYLVEYNYYNSINVYAFESNLQENLTIPSKIKSKEISYFLCPIKSEKKGEGYKNIIKYVNFHYHNFKKYSKKKDHVILIGSVVMAPVLLRNLFLIKTKKIRLITWIRSKVIGEMKANRSNFVFISKLLERFVLSLSDLIITNGKDTLNYYTSRYKKYRDKLTMIENGIETNKFNDIEINDINAPIKIAYTGRYSRAKGFDDYNTSIDLFFKHNKEDFKKILFFSFGHGELESTTSKYLINKGRYSQDDLKEILSSVDVVVFLNKSNNSGGLSHSLLEVMAAGKIIIAWKNDVHCQILNENNSFLIEEGNINELTKVYKTLIKDTEEIKNELKSKRLNARKTSEGFTCSNHVQKFVEIVKKLDIIPN